MDTILSKSGNEFEEVITPWGIYYAVAFKKVSGKQIAEMRLTEDIIFGWGEALGKLHKLSSEFNLLHSFLSIDYNLRRSRYL